MKRFTTSIFTSIIAAVCAVPLLAGAAVAAPALPGSSGSSDTVSGAVHQIDSAVQDSWRGAYGAMPPKVRAAVPPEMRPRPTSAVPKPGPEPHTPGKPAEPKPDPNCSNCVALTFDDGPVPETNRLLDILDRKHAKASFFVVGVNAERYAPTLRRIRDGGHTIGNHTDTHPKLPALSDPAIAQQMDVSNRTMRIVTGRPNPRWIRPPYGEYDARVQAAAKQRGMALALWDVDTRDWQHRNAQTTCNIAVSNARAGSIVLMHDIHAPTVNAVECIIDGLRAKGLRPVTLDELIPGAQPGRVYTAKQ